MSTIRADTLSTRTGTYSTSMENPVRGSARAWVNFNGTGTVAIRTAFNVTSITDNGTGDYTLNFTNALTDANYVPSFGAVSLNATANHDNTIQIQGTAASAVTTKTTTALRIDCGNITAATRTDQFDVNVAIFGT
jgi:hypothetical protein